MNPFTVANSLTLGCGMLRRTYRRDTVWVTSRNRYGIRHRVAGPYWTFPYHLVGWIACVNGQWFSLTR